MFKEISIIGLGFMGASIAGAVKRTSPDTAIKGCDINEKNLEYCISKGIVDSEIVFDEDLGHDRHGFEYPSMVLLCVPPDAIISILDKYESYFKNIPLITDIGSVKHPIVNAVKINKFKLAGFVGSHPMCGSDKYGPEYADFNLFKGKNCIVIKDEEDLLEQVRIEKILRVASFWESIGMNIVYSTSAFHDEMAAYASHLPHLIAYSLSRTVLNAAQKNREKGSFNFIASGFMDSTRIASSSPDIWTDIFLMNRENLIKSLNSFMSVADTFKNLLEKGDKEGLRSLILNISGDRKAL